MDQFNQSIKVLGRHLSHVSIHRHDRKGRSTYSIILLVKVIDIAVENLDEQLNRHGRVHASVSHPEGTLQTFEYPLAITVELAEN